MDADMIQDANLFDMLNNLHLAHETIEHELLSHQMT